MAGLQTYIFSLEDCIDFSVDVIFFVRAVSRTGGNLAARQTKCKLGVLWLPNGTTAPINIELLSQARGPYIYTSNYF